MTTLPPPLLSTLNETASPPQRAERLNQLAEAHLATGQPAQARLLRLVAQTELLLADPDRELEDDPAWDDDYWWRLAGTSDREDRADLLEVIYREWAAPQFGHNAAVLMDIAETERHAFARTEDDLDRTLREARTAQLAAIDATFDFEAGLAEVYARAGIPSPQASPAAPPPEGYQVALDEPDEEAADAPSTAVRDLVSVVAKVGGAIVVLAVPVLLVALPQTSWHVRVGAAVALTLLSIGWAVWQICRRPLVIRGPQR